MTISMYSAIMVISEAIGIAANTSAVTVQKETSVLEGLGDLLSNNDMPVWLSLILALTASVGTYFLAPNITRRLEIGKARSGHVISAINEINKVVVSLNKSIRAFIFSFRVDENAVEEKRSLVLDHVTELQWRIIDLKVILRKCGDTALLEGLGQKIEHLRQAVNELKTASNQDGLLAKVSAVSEDLKLILDRLYKEANLK